jgi:hypothetical protein
MEQLAGFVSESSFFLWCDFFRKASHRQENLHVPRQISEGAGSTLDDIFLRWYDETRILEVHGVYLSRPHSTP